MRLTFSPSTPPAKRTASPYAAIIADPHATSEDSDPDPDEGLLGYLRAAAAGGREPLGLSAASIGGYDAQLAASGSPAPPPAPPATHAERGLAEAETVAQSTADLAGDINFAQRDWNDEYQTLLEARPPDAAAVLTRARQLRALYEAFARAATAIATTIISERFMRPEERSVEVIEKLGVAGGEKYVHRNQRIFIKMCVDRHGLYGGDEGAAKAAGNELSYALCDGPWRRADCRAE